MARHLFERPVDDRYDRNIFMLAFFVGFVGILATRIIGDLHFDPTRLITLTDWYALLISIAIIFLYTLFIVRTTDRASISLDRAGDNAYYLGLLFTLVSLGYSLYKVVEIVGGSSSSELGDASSLRASDRVIRLLPDFGLALGSTITGIFCRVLVQQMRNDPVDIEMQARQELGRAVWELRASLLRAVADINSLSHSTNAATTEMVAHINKTLEEAALTDAAAMSSVGSMLREVEQELGKQARNMSEFSERVMREVGAVVTNANDQFSRLKIDPTDIQAHLGEVSSELAKMQVQLSHTTEAQKDIANALAAVSAQIASSFSSDLASRLQSAAEETFRRHEQVLSQLDELETGVSETGQKISGLTENVARAGDELAQAREASRNALNSTKLASSEYVETLADAAKKLRRSIDDNT